MHRANKGKGRREDEYSLWPSICSVSFHFEDKCVITCLYNPPRNGFYSVEKWHVWRDEISENETRMTIIVTVLQYPHMIEAITCIYFVPVWLHSLFHSSQNVSHINKQLLCWKSKSTCSVIFSKWNIVKFCYSINTRKVIMFLVKQNIQWWDEWLVGSQMIPFVISSISISRITRALCNGKLFH